MKYTFKGSLCGYLCEDCFEPFYGMEVLLYLPWQKDRVLENAVASTKETFHLVTKEEAAERKSLLIATTQTDENGNFEFTVDEKYGNTAFDIDFTCGTVPRTPPKPPRKKPIQIHLTTVYPQWRISKEQESYFYKWEYCVAYKNWCFIRGYYFDAWVICGYLRGCETGAAIPNAIVTAWDADFLTDDNLGTATTDASGHFRIDYTSIQFKQTFLSPWINVETDPGWPLTFQSGPDVYFKAEIGGVTLIDEKKADCRKNVGYCLCVDLCAKVDVPIDEPVPVPAFLRIGSIDYEIQMHSHVTESGLTNSNYAFFSSLRLNGILSQTFGGIPMEYCFEYSNDFTGPGQQPINWQRVLPNLIDDTDIGYVEKATLMPADAAHLFVPWYDYDYQYCRVTNGPVPPGFIQVPIAADGWILVPQQHDNPLNALGVGMFVANNDQIRLNSTKLDPFPAIDLTGLVAGNSAGPTLANDKIFAIKMLVRQQGNDLTKTEAGRCTRIAIDNTLYTGMRHHPEWGAWGPVTEYGVCMLDIQQLIMAGCSKITNQVDILYTIAHPNIGSIGMTLTGPLPPVNLVVPVTQNSFGTITHNFAVTDPLCAYLVTLTATYLLTTGDSNLSSVQDQIAFCR